MAGLERSRLRRYRPPSVFLPLEIAHTFLPCHIFSFLFFPRGDVDFVGQAYKLVLQTLDGKYQVEVAGTSYNKTVAASIGEPVFNYEQFISNASISAGQWQAVPEPTSGLLLLLGVAGLALRRRRT